MRYFVTGATGFIGGYFVRQLLERGHQVVALVRTPEKARHLADLGVELHKGDITDRESLRAPMTGVDGVFHMAAWYKLGARDTSMAEPINVGGTRNVLEMMRELGIAKGVYTSTVAVFSDTKGRVVDESYRYDGPHLSEYDRTKWKAHYEVALPMMRQGLPLVVVQPGLVYGPGDESSVHETFVSYLKGKLPVLPAGTTYCWGYVEDMAMAHILAMDAGRAGESYITAGPPHTLIDAMSTAQRITGIKAPKVHMPPGVMRVMAGITKVAGAILPLPAMYSAETLRSTAGVTNLASSEKAKRELGFTARSLEDGLRPTLAYEMKSLGMTRP